MSKTSKAFVHISKNLGRYDLASYDKDWNLSLRTSYGNISAMFDEEDEPEIEGAMPSEVLDMIEERIESYWISTSREKDRKKIKEIREHLNELDLIWAKEQLSLYQRQVEVYNSLVQEILERKYALEISA